MQQEFTREKVTPNFAIWQHATLVQFATEAFRRLIDMDEANESLRRDLKDALNLVRESYKREQDDML